MFVETVEISVSSPRVAASLDAHSAHRGWRGRGPARALAVDGPHPPAPVRPRLPHQHLLLQFF